MERIGYVCGEGGLFLLRYLVRCCLKVAEEVNNCAMGC